MIDLLFIVLLGTLLLDLAGPAEAFRLADQALLRHGKPAAFRLRYAGPLAAVVSSVVFMLSGIEPLPDQRGRRPPHPSAVRVTGLIRHKSTTTPPPDRQTPTTSG